MIDDIIIVGAGVAGMSAARVLAEKGYKIRVLESQRYVGGRLHNIDLGDVRVEVGAQFITNFYTNALALAGQLGINGELVRINPRLAAAQEGELQDLQSVWSVVLGRTLPYRAIPFVLRESLRVLAHWHQLDPGAVWKSAKLDERGLASGSASEGERAFVASLLEPALEQFMYWDAQETSTAFSPILIKAAMILRKVVLFRDGFESFVRRGFHGIPVECDAKVADIHSSTSGWYDCELADGRSYQCRAVIMACDAETASRIWANFPKQLEDFMRRVKYSSTIVVSSRVRRPVPNLAFGIMNRGKRPVDIAAVTVLARRGWPVLPEGQNVVQAFSSESAAARLIDSSDEDVLNEIDQSVVREYGSAFGLTSSLMESSVHRWVKALPKFEPGCLRRLYQVQSALSEPMPVAPAGDYLSGPFIEGAVQSGAIAAASVGRYLELVS